MKEVFGTDKPVIGMLHLMALPTDPKDAAIDAGLHGQDHR